MLTFAQHNTTSTAFMQQAVHFGSGAVQVATQATAPVDFSIPQNDSGWPNTKDLAQAPYLDAPGHWAPLGATVKLIEADTSFGDLNGDGLDDAAVIVNRPSSNGAPNYYLAAMLNQGGIMFDVADLSLGTVLDIATHSVSHGNILLNNISYELLGDEIIKQ